MEIQVDSHAAVDEAEEECSTPNESEWEYEYLEESEECICHICGDIYADIEELETHIDLDHCRFSCSHCDKRYYTESLLKKHLRHAHLPSLNLKCFFCDKVFRTKYSLQQHTITHNKEPVFKCSFEGCNKRFRHINSLKQHTDLHLGKNRKVCPICQENVTRITTHLLTHSKEKPFQCDKCEKQFTTEKHLDRHKFTIHSGGTFDCSDCSASYKNLSSLYKHRRAIHFQIKFSCPKCERTFNRKDNLIVHGKKLHDIDLNTASQLRKPRESRN